MTINYSIRRAAEKDISDIIALGRMLQNESRAFEPELIFDQEEAYRHYKKELTNDDAFIMVAEADSKIIGYQYSYIKALDYLKKNNLECTLEALYVVPDCRCRGVASKLISEAENWAIHIKNVARLKANIYTGNTPSENLHIQRGYSVYCSEYLKDLKGN